MSRLNQPKATVRTHEGATAYHLNPELVLRRTVMACMLWERSFYENGQDVADRIAALVPQVPAERVASMAREARDAMKLRHVPLLLAVELTKHVSHRHVVAGLVEHVVQRPDELTELLAIYARQRDGRKRLNRLSKGIERGIARAFPKFDAYQLAKYDRKGEVRLRDALFLSHAKPKDEAQAKAWKKLIAGTLEAPDTWEVALSEAGSEGDKREVWTRLLTEGRLGAMAMLRNLRNMRQAGVGLGLIRGALGSVKPTRVLPFRFVAAARAVPELEPELEALMFSCLADAPKLGGRTVLVVDHSASMRVAISPRSDMTRFDAAAALGMLLREVCEDCSVVVFSRDAAVVPARRGFALRDAMEAAIPWGGTNTQTGIALANEQGCDRMIVLTDEQSHQAVSSTPWVLPRGYFVNVASYKNGIGYGEWVHIDGWSEAVVDYVRAHEAEAA